MQNNLLLRQNNIKEQQLDEIMQKIIEMRQEMAQEVDAFTRVSLQLQVQKFQINSMRNLLLQNQIEIPADFNNLMEELEGMKNFNEDQLLDESADFDHNDQRVSDEEHKQKLLGIISNRI